MAMKIEKREAWWTSKGAVSGTAKGAMLAELAPQLEVFNRYTSGGIGAGILLRYVFDKEFERLELLVQQFRSMIDYVEMIDSPDEED